MIAADSLVVASADQISSDLAGEAVILHLGQGMYYGLDAVGARIWELVQQPSTPAAICDTIVAEYDVTPERCMQDVLALLDELVTTGLVEVRDAGAA